MVYPPPVKKKFWKLYSNGFSIKEAATETGVSYATARAWARYNRNGNAAAFRAERQAENTGPIPYEQLSKEAKRALKDFSYFQRRYFGRIAVPWQKEAAEIIVKLLESPHEEYAVINAPPGSGKSTTFTMDIPAWLTCRNRSIRGLIGSETQSQANWYIGRLRREFERPIPLKGDLEAVNKGLALDAEATLSQDFGRFKPTDSVAWSKESFLVEQMGSVLTSEKEHTWQGFGYRGGFLGGRFNFVIWDDVITISILKNSQAVAELEQWWKDIAESRLDPGGLMVLQGQRLGPNDLYHFAKEMRMPNEVDDDSDGYDQSDGMEVKKKYHSIIFKSHYEELCRGKETHKLNSLPYPDGCLLYPRRLPWRKLATLRENDPERFEVLYQQADLDPSSVLVDSLWVKGGMGADGRMYPGCWDKDRDVWEPITGRTGEMIYIATADPSPTKFWAVELWGYHPDTQQKFLIDLLRQKMDAPDFLDYDHEQQGFVGIMEEWQQRSVEKGMPITYWIVERNAAQRFILQFDHVRRWQQRWQVEIVAHDTYEKNRVDPLYGIEAMAPDWKFGRIRLPGKDFPSRAKITSLKLIDEVTRWPYGNTDDCLMAEWFMHWTIPRLSLDMVEPEVAFRPSWI